MDTYRNKNKWNGKKWNWNNKSHKKNRYLWDTASVNNDRNWTYSVKPMWHQNYTWTPRN